MIEAAMLGMLGGDDYRGIGGISADTLDTPTHARQSDGRLGPYRLQALRSFE